MRLLTLILLIGGLAVFFVQNRQPIALVFLGSVLKVQLPLALWVLLFVGAGALTSLFLQALNALLGSSSPPRARDRDFSPPPSPPPRQRLASNQSSAELPPQQVQEEWDDWDLEEPSAKPVARQAVDAKIQEGIPENKIPNLEVRQQPESFSRQGSVYSYSYRKQETGERPPENSSATPQEMPQDIRETTKTASRQRDRVYDADYRIITPPYRPSTESDSPPEEDDEEWV